MKLLKKINQKAFSLLEVVIVTTIFMFGISGISSLMLQNVQAQNYNFDYLTASMLAQEGIELVRNVRDENWLNPEYEKTIKWYEDIYKNSGSGDYHFVIYMNENDKRPYIDPSVVNIDESGARLFIDSGSNGFYQNNTSGKFSGFSRLVTTKSSVSNPEYLDVEVLVQWHNSGRTNKYITQTKLYNWR